VDLGGPPDHPQQTPGGSGHGPHMGFLLSKSKTAEINSGETRGIRKSWIIAGEVPNLWFILEKSWDNAIEMDTTADVKLMGEKGYVQVLGRKERRGTVFVGGRKELGEKAPMLPGTQK